MAGKSNNKAQQNANRLYSVASYVNWIKADKDAHNILLEAIDKFFSDPLNSDVSFSMAWNYSDKWKNITRLISS